MTDLTEARPADIARTVPAPLYVLIPTLAFLFAILISPLWALVTGTDETAAAGEVQSQLIARLVWPALAAASVALTAVHWRTLAPVSFPRGLLFLIAYMAIAAASVSWAIEPDISLRRYIAQVFILISVVVPTLFANRSAVIMRDLFICLAIVTAVNLAFVMTQPPTDDGHPGYFSHKNTMGVAQALAFIFALHECSYRGKRRFQGIVIAAAALVLLVASQSKTSLALALVAPVLGAAVIGTAAVTRISSALVVLYLAAVGSFSLMLLSDLYNFDFHDFSVLVFGDPTFTGRTTIWSWVVEMIARRPLVGWGYQSFWLVGPSAPSMVEAPEWVPTQPHAHNGYLDVLLETGFLGLTVLIALILAALHGAGRIAEKEPRRAWLSMTLLLFVIVYNTMESTWLRGGDPTWLLVVIVLSESRRPWSGGRSRGVAPSTAKRPAGPSAATSA